MNNIKVNYEKNIKTISIYKGRSDIDRFKNKRQILPFALMGDKRFEALTKIKNKIFDHKELATQISKILQPYLDRELFAISEVKCQNGKLLSVGAAKFIINCVLVALGCFDSDQLQPEKHEEVSLISKLICFNLFKKDDPNLLKRKTKSNDKSVEYFSEEIINEVFEEMKQQFGRSLFPAMHENTINKIKELVSEHPFVLIRYFAEYDMLLGGHHANVVSRLTANECDKYFKNYLASINIDKQQQDEIINICERFLLIHDIGKLDGYLFKMLTAIQKRDFEEYDALKQKLMGNIKDTLQEEEKGNEEINTQTLDEFDSLCTSYKNGTSYDTFVMECDTLIQKNRRSFIVLNKYGINKSEQANNSKDIIKTFNLFAADPGQSEFGQLVSEMLMWSIDNDIMGDTWQQKLTLEEAATKFSEKISTLTKEVNIACFLLDIAFMYHFCDAGSYLCLEKRYFGFEATFAQYVRTESIVKIKDYCQSKLSLLN